MLKNEKDYFPKLKAEEERFYWKRSRTQSLISMRATNSLECVLVKKNIQTAHVKQHMQKSLLLINLKELHLESKKATDLKIRFSKFCELRLKWCIPEGSASGAHSVCLRVPTKSKAFGFCNTRCHWLQGANRNGSFWHWK